MCSSCYRGLALPPSLTFSLVSHSSGTITLVHAAASFSGRTAFLEPLLKSSTVGQLTWPTRRLTDMRGLHSDPLRKRSQSHLVTESSDGKRREVATQTPEGQRGESSSDSVGNVEDYVSSF